MSGRSRWRTAAALVALLACASAKSARAESAFEASPREKALVVVDVMVRHKTLLAQHESPVIGGSMRNRALDGKPSAPKPSVHAVEGLLPFALEPGRYRPAAVRARVNRMQIGTGTIDLTIPMPTDSVSALDVTVTPGALVYLGRVDVLVVPRPFKENEYRFGFSSDRDRERTVWETLLAKAKTGPWEEAIRARLAGLAAVADSGAVTTDAPADSTR